MLNLMRPLWPALPLALAAATLSASAGPVWSQTPCETFKTGAPSDTASSGSRFGNSVALQGDLLVIGEQAGGSTVPPPGRAHIFERDTITGAWAPAATVSASDAGDHADDFGCSVATDGQTVVVGATQVGDYYSKGAAYVFERQTDGTWIETAKLVPPDKVWALGWSCDVEGDRIAVGAKGAVALGDGAGRVVLFERSAGSWAQKAVIKPGPSIGGDGFGQCLDLEGDRLVVGATYGWTGSCAPYCEGRAFVFERHPDFGTWYQKAVLAPDDLADGDYFGQDVALDGDRIVVGAMQHDLPQFNIGAAYVFDDVDGSWVQTGKITPGDLPSSTQFGAAVDVEGGRVVVGARGDGEAAPSGGAAYLFEEGTEGWKEVAKFHGSDPQLGDSFGFAVDLEGSEVAVGSPHIGGDPGPHGKAYVFDLDPEGPSLVTDGSDVSLSAGGAQSFQLGACPAHAGDIYVFAGSASGTSPGFAFAGKSVPLNADAYLVFTASNLGAPPLVGGLGLLDASGRADAAFQLPAGVLQPALAGVVLHHAYAVLDGTTLQLEAVSNAVPVALVP
jgi:hypothetical protein